MTARRIGAAGGQSSSPDSPPLSLRRLSDYRGSWRAGAPGAVRAVLVNAALATIACGIVSAALWFVWRLAEIVP